MNFYDFFGMLLIQKWHQQYSQINGFGEVEFEIADEHISLSTIVDTICSFNNRPTYIENKGFSKRKRLSIREIEYLVYEIKLL